MPDLPTRQTYFQIGADEVLARSAARPIGQRISAEEVFTEGSDINIVTASASAMAEEVTRQLALREKVLLLDGASGIDLDRIVGDRFSPTVVRKQAVPSVVPLIISRSLGPLAAITLPIGTKVRTGSSFEFATTSAVSLAAGSTGPVTVLAEATVAGTAGNVAAGTITQFSEPPADPNLIVVNEEPAAGGDDEEKDPALRARARDFFRQARRGTLGAIEFGALTVPGVRQASAIEEVDPGGLPTGRVSIFVADAQGQANSALVTAVLLALLEYRAAGIIVDVLSAIPEFVSIRFRLRFSASVNTTVAAESVRLAAVAAVNVLRPNAVLPVSLLFAAARSVPGVIVLDDAIVAPVGDLVPALGQVIRTRPDLVTFE